MIPSRGLPPLQLASLASRQSSVLRSQTSRKFSSVPRSVAFSAPSCRKSPLRSADWRTGASSTPNARLSASTVRYGSWYAPWTWGSSSTPPGSATKSPTELAPEPVPVAESVVTTATPELQPAGVDQTAFSSNTSTSDSKLIEDILNHELPQAPVVDTMVDPTAPISYWGNLKDLGLDFGWGPTAFYENLVELTYLYADVAWPGAIVTSALILRFGLFWGFQRPGSHAAAKMAAVQPILQPLTDQLEEAKRQGDDDRAQMLKMKQQGIMNDVGVDAFKTLSTGIAQGIFGFGAFRCLRNMGNLPVPGMTTEGWAWFTDLTVADPYYVLPLATGGLMYCIMRMGGETGLANAGSMTSLQKKAQIGMPLFMVVVTAWQPAALQLYFVCTSLTGGLTAYALRQPGFRRFIRIRPLPTPESNALYSKVVKGDIPLDSIRGPDGKIRYQAPAPTTSRPKPTISSINIKRGAVLPAHIQAPAQEKDEAEAMPKGPLSQKLKWANGNYGLAALKKKAEKAFDQRDPEVKRRQEKLEERKRADKKYELERKKRFQSGR